MSGRRLALTVAAVLAVVGAWVVIGTRGGTEGESAGGARMVVRVVADIPEGAAADQALADGALEVVEVSPGELESGDVVGPDSLAGTVATTDVPSGVLLAPGLFAPPVGPGAALVARLPTAGHTALAVTVDATRAVGGWVQPGDRVNLLVPGVCANEAAAQEVAAATGTEVRCRRARYLYQAVDVLAVGGTLGAGGDVGGERISAGPVTVVLSLPPRAAQWVATWENELVLALVPPGYVPRVVDPLPVVVDRLPGERAETIRPGCSDPDAPGPADETATCSGGEGP